MDCKFFSKCWRYAYSCCLEKNRFKNDEVPTRLSLFEDGFATIEMMHNGGKGGIFCEKFPHLASDGRLLHICPAKKGLNPKECLEYKKEEKRLERYEARKKQKTYKRASIPPDVRIQVFRRDKFKCRYCGASNNNIKCQIDHIIPVSKGGTNEIDNLCLACRDCNLKKYNKIYAEHKKSTLEDGE